MDHITDLPPSWSGGNTFNAILVVVDCLTKYVVFIPATKWDIAATLAQQLHQFVFVYFSRPDTIMSEQGTTFVSMMWGELLCLLRVWGSYYSTYHPQMDSQKERTNQSLELFLHLCTAYDHSDWASLLPLAQLSLIDRPLSTTHTVPNHVTLLFAPQIHPYLSPPTVSSPMAHLLPQCQEGIH